MFKTIRGDRWRRGVVMSAVFSMVVSAMALDARGVILYSTSDRNTSAPSDLEGLDAWNLQAEWGSYLATPIDATHFIASKHIYLASSTITFREHDYEVDALSRVVDPDSDLCIYSISGDTFPAYATLYDTSVDGSEIGKTLTVIGRGTQRGGEVKVGDDLKGWYWGSSDRVQSWGQNIVSDFADFSASSQDSLLSFTFDSDGVSNESALSTGDSSGGVFIYADDQWKLAGISYAVDGPFSLTGTGPKKDGFSASIFDAQGLYYWDSDSGWEYVSDHVPGASYASRISDRLDWIYSVVPEPGTIVMLISAGAFLSIFAFRGLRGKSI